MTLDQILLAAILGVLVVRWLSETGLYRRITVNGAYKIKRLLRRA